MSPCGRRRTCWGFDSLSHLPPSSSSSSSSVKLHFSDTINGAARPAGYSAIFRSLSSVGTRSALHNFHIRQQMRLHGVARHPLQRRPAAPVHHRLRPRQRRLQAPRRPRRLGRPLLGPHPLLPGLRRQVLLPHRRLRLRTGRVLRQRRHPAGHPRRVHPRRLRRHGLLRRQPRGRVQPAGAGGAAGRDGPELHHHGVRGRPERGLPVGAEGDEQRRVGGRGVQERVRGVPAAAVLLQRRLRHAADVQALVVLGAVQGRLPAGLQLRVRRQHQHLHVRRRRLRHHLLPISQRQPEILVIFLVSRLLLRPGYAGHGGSERLEFCQQQRDGVRGRFGSKRCGDQPRSGGVGRHRRGSLADVAALLKSSHCLLTYYYYNGKQNFIFL